MSRCDRPLSPWMWRIKWLALLPAGVASACGQAAQPPAHADVATTDTTIDTAIDASTDTAGDAATDAGADACGQAVVDAAPPNLADVAITPVPCKQFDLPVGTCFQAAPPKPGDFVADVPQPASPCADVGAPPWFDASAVPPPTLPLQIGYRDPQGQFIPYKNGDWVPLQTANQGGFHVELVPSVDLPCQPTAVVPLAVQSFAAVDCNEIATLGTNKAAFIHVGGGRWTLRPETKLFTVFGTSIANMSPYCGIWMHVWWRVRIPGTTQWGEVVRVLRSWDGTCNQPPAAPP